jgi:glycosyltransferase involved in cell wall biosynthesis
MKVLFCITRSDTIGGAHVHVMQLASHLLSSDVETSVIVGGNGVFVEALRDEGIPVVTSKSLGRPIAPLADARSVFELRSLFRKLNPGLISLHSAKAGVVGRLAAVGLRVPVLFTAHGWAFTEGVSSRRAGVFRMLERRLAPLADRIVCVSEYDRQLALSQQVGQADQLRTVLNGMPQSDRMARPDEQANPLRIICVARLDNQKDHATLFKALSRLADREWTLDLVGDGPLEGELRRLAAESGIADRVAFLGLRRDVEDLLIRSHVFVLPSNWEGLPRSILEAMRAGLPVVASNVGGVAETVVEGQTGYLVPRRDHGRMNERLRQLLDDAELRGQLGRQGRLRFESDFTLERMIGETLDLYDELLGAP